MRLAHRQKRLEGKDIGQVQSYALKLLMVHERIEATREKDETFKQRVAAGDFDRFYKRFFPDEKSSDPTEDAIKEDGTVDYSKVDVTKVPDAPAPRSEDEREQLKKWIENVGLGDITGQVTGAELGEGGWGDWL